MSNEQNESDAKAHPVDTLVKCFRCGWCGAPTNKDGLTLTLETINEMAADWNFAESVNGNCCAGQRDEDYWQEMQQITKDMAMDAGDMSLEGQYI